jgi:hypothetical protein
VWAGLLVTGAGGGGYDTDDPWDPPSDPSGVKRGVAVWGTGGTARSPLEAEKDPGPPPESDPGIVFFRLEGEEVFAVSLNPSCSEGKRRRRGGDRGSREW